MPHSRQLRERCSRLSKMGWDELRVRGCQEVAKAWDAVTHMGRSFRDENYDPSVRSLGRFFFAPEDVPMLCDALREQRPDAVYGVIAQAEEICRHRFDLLGYHRVDYGEEIDWHLDRVHGKQAPRRPWFLVPYLDFDQVGDAKVTWELSRHQHLVTLAKAYRLTNESGYLTELLKQWYHWQEHNPYGIGINWASSLEVAFRSLSWIWILQLLKGCDAAPPVFSADVGRALVMNARHIERFLSTYFSPNTHLLGEGMGIFFIGTLVAGSPRATSWREKGWKIILQEAARQIQPDGMHFEQSIYYHVYALDFCLHARILAGINGMPIPATFDETLMKMLTALAGLANPGPVPGSGDDDGGRLFDGRRNRRDHITDPLCLGAALFNNCQLKNSARGISEETIWLLGCDGAKRFSELDTDPRQVKSFALASSGIYVMQGLNAPGQQLVVDAGPQSAGRPGHGHADALSVQVGVNGRMLLVDPGTSVYVDESKERERFRSTAAHNTVQVDSVSQAEPAGPFGWQDLPRVTSDRWITGESFDLFAGSHDGYTRLPDPVVHRRHIFCLKDKLWLVRDVLIGEEKHQFQCSWHFAPGKLSSISGGVHFSHPDGPGLSLLLAGRKNYQHAITQGLFSPVYGMRVPAPVVHFGGIDRLPAELATLLLPASEVLIEPGFFNMAEESDSGGSLRSYVYSTSVEESYFIFCDEPKKWKRGPWASDASFLFCRIDANETLAQFVLCEGSFLEFRGQCIFASSTPVQRAEWYQKDAVPRFCCSAKAAVEVHPLQGRALNHLALAI